MPGLGNRVAVRYRTEVPGQLTDAIGILEATRPAFRVRTRTGAVVEVDPTLVDSVRELPFHTVRNSDIRNLEHAAALAWPGTEQHWLHGWLLRAGGGATKRANSAVPLDFSAGTEALTEIAAWYHERDLPAWLAVPERLLPVRAAGVDRTRVMVREVPASGAPDDAPGRDAPDAHWLQLYQREVPPQVLSAVVNGVLRFVEVAGAAVGRGALTTAPDGTRWLGISAVHTAPSARRQGHARAVTSTLLAWGAAQRAQRSYVQVQAHNLAAIALYESLDFRLHHHYRYLPVADLLAPTI